MNDSGYKGRVEECLAYLSDIIPRTPEIILQLGTGLGLLAESLNVEVQLPYQDLPHFPTSTVASHSGNLLFGRLSGRDVVVLQGRFHYYEGYSTKEIAFPIRVLALLGAKTLILTNAAGGLNPLYHPGSIMVIRDHLNFLGENPLRGPNIEEWGPRFPDLSTPYDPGLIKIALDSAGRCNLNNVITGVYICIPGPSLETPSETRWLRDAGGDGVGMSSVPEVLVAIHAGIKVLGLSVVANVNDPDNFAPILLDDVLAVANTVEPQLKQLITDILANI